MKMPIIKIETRELIFKKVYISYPSKEWIWFEDQKKLHSHIRRLSWLEINFRCIHRLVEYFYNLYKITK